jgi:hypothetical protein
MTETLFAMLKSDDGYEIRRVPVDANVQAQLDILFEDQEKSFLDGVEKFIEFNGLYKPEADEMLFIDDSALTQSVVDATEQNALAYDSLDISQLGSFRVQFIFRKSTINKDRVLLQKFSPKQYLSSHAFAVILRQETYTRLVEPGFSLDEKVSAYIINSKVYFRSFFQLRTMFTVTNHFFEATRPQVEAFSEHEKVKVDNAALFVSNADQTCRRLIYSIERSNVLNILTADIIARKAAEVGLDLALDEDRIVIPSARACCF